MKAEGFLRSNVRVSVLCYEEVGYWMERYGLEDVLCFSTDYPHVEGGKRAAMSLYDKVSPLGDAVVEKFFVTNGELLFPHARMRCSRLTIPTEN
jgi:hypothetical protein